MKVNVKRVGIAKYITSITKFINKLRSNKRSSTNNDLKSTSIFIYENTMYQMILMYEPLYGIVKTIDIYDIDNKQLVTDESKILSIIEPMDYNTMIAFNYSCTCGNSKLIFRVNLENLKRLPLICQCHKCNNYSFILNTDDIVKGYSYDIIEDDFTKLIKNIKEY